MTPQVTPEVTGEVTPQATPQVIPQVTGEVTGEDTPEVRLLRMLSGEMTRQSLQEALGLKHRDHFNQVYLMPVLQAGLIDGVAPLWWTPDYCAEEVEVDPDNWTVR